MAAGAHVALGTALMMVRSPGAHGLAPPAPASTEALFELSDLPPRPPGPSPAAPAAPEAPAAESTRAIATRAPPTSRPLPPEAPRAAPDVTEPAPPATASAQPWSLAAPGTLALGVGDYWKHVALEGPAPSSSAPPPDPRSAEIERTLRLGPSRDMELGLGSSGPLISAAHEAASMAPDVGAATLDIDVEGSGKVVTARVVTASADMAAWNALAREIVRIASSRVVRVRPGSHGVRARLRVVAERAPPAGTKRTSSAGAVADDIPGGMDGKACDGEGPERRCAAGMPLGGTTTIGDLSNLGAQPSRIVHVSVLGEAAL